jgi:rhodanese-related sulfurtransferase
MSDVPEVTVQELSQELAQGANLCLVDVREGDELGHGHLPGIVHIPLGDLPENLGRLDRGADIVVICRTGGRSGKATQQLLDAGFSKVRNMVGGMNAWATEVDRTMQPY